MRIELLQGYRFPVQSRQPFKLNVRLETVNSETLWLKGTDSKRTGIIFCSNILDMLFQN